MASFDQTAAEAVLKVYYGPKQERIQDLVYATNPLYALVSKFTMFEGKNMPFPILFGHPQGVSFTFSSAQGGKTASKYEDFVLTRKKVYGTADIDGETIRTSKSDKGAFVRALTSEIDNTIKSVARRLATSLYRKGSGTIGAAGSVSTVNVTLANIDDVANFEVGMRIQASSADGGGALRDSGDFVTLTNINRDTGVLTADSAWATTITGFVAGDFLIPHGDYDAAIAGLLGWVPSTAPTSTAWFGVDRSVDVTRLGGIRYDGSAEPIDEALTGAARRAGREGAMVDHCFLNHKDWASLEKALGAKVRYGDVELKVGKVGFRTLKIAGPAGDIDVLADHNCPSGRAFMLQLDTWTLASAGPLVSILEEDGLKILRASSSDGYEVRVGGYGNLVCQAPGFNVNVTLPT